MANVEFHTGFEGCGSTEDAKTLFADAGGGYGWSLDLTHGYNGSKCIKINAYSNTLINLIPGKTKSFGCNFVPSGLSAVKFWMVDSSGKNFTITANATDGIVAKYNNVKLADSGGVCPAINPMMTHIEFKVFSDPTAGTFQVWLNGGIVIDASALNTGGYDIVQANMGVGLSSTWAYVDDIHVADDWVGHSTVIPILPSANHNVTFTPNSGENFEAINEDGQDGDASYVETILTNQDLYEYEDIDIGLTVIAASLVTVARKTGAGKYPVYLHQIAKQGTTEYHKDDSILGINYPCVPATGKRDQFPTAPDGTPWTPTVLNAMKWGFKATLTSL